MTYIAKVKKLASNLEDAVGRAQVIYGPMDTWKSEKKFFDRITEFMKISKVCTISDNCSIQIDSNGSAGKHSRYAVILADGSVLDFDMSPVFGDFTVRVDIDGLNKGANKSGFDVFKFHFENNGLQYDSHDYVRFYNRSFFDITDATLWILMFDNMDYLKTNDGTTCPNGTKLTFSGNHACK